MKHKKIKKYFKIFLIFIFTIFFLSYFLKKNIKIKNLNSKKNKINHLGIIMDGNRRWAKVRNIKLNEGYKKGGEKLQEIISFCIENNINNLSIYALSLDNIKKRTKEEIDSIYSIIDDFLESELNWFIQKKISVNIIGDLSYVPDSVKNKIDKFKEKIPEKGSLNVNILFAYDYLNDIEYGIKNIISDLKSGKLNESDINNKTIFSYLRSKEIPYVDLIVRTGNVERISGFLPLQSAYSEIIYLSCMWPDIEKSMLESILEEFVTKTRNFGK